MVVEGKGLSQSLFVMLIVRRFKRD